MNDKLIDELTLMLLYLTSWKDNSRFSEGDEIFAWKGYDFTVLNNLENDDYIHQGSHPSKSKKVYLTEEGINKAKELLSKYSIG